jgi:hypothetical protein
MLQMNRVMDITNPDPFALLCSQIVILEIVRKYLLYLPAGAIPDGHMLFTPFRVGRLRPLL